MSITRMRQYEWILCGNEDDIIVIQDGATPLMFAACEVGTEAIVSLLLSSGAIINDIDGVIYLVEDSQLTEDDDIMMIQCGGTALMDAAGVGSIEIVLLLLSHGADIHLKNDVCTNHSVDIEQ